ncbi:DUF6412 domain-containing protein [Nocardiopsis ansamitocini]|uniref:Uncharacterized protein n=1 Tax=Nocardiopsis ansamitocini TaxID=1670832 RepID=A0A9W6UI53_9ACTN|nr:DUF6412 domain-containing protein [Nocardiopsis ansamitocini]GLU47329.1 hypothetical protein Nans01_16800 [Nocardiopsis ansamitocini]
MELIYTLFHTLFFGTGGLGVFADQIGLGPFALLAILAVGTAIVWITARGYGSWPFADTRIHAWRGAMRTRERRATAIVSRDPDAPGKTKPRAPGAALLAA